MPTRTTRLVAVFAVIGVLSLALALAIVSPRVSWADPNPPASEDQATSVSVEPAQTDPRQSSPVQGQSADAVAGTGWFSTAGAAFMPSLGSISYTYGGSGCIAPSTGGQWRSSINLPHGTTLASVYFDYQNNASSTASTIWVTQYHYGGTFTDLIAVTSQPATAVGSGFKWVSGTFATPHVMNNAVYAYVIVWSGSTNQELCGVQINYTPSTVPMGYLPFVKK